MTAWSLARRLLLLGCAAAAAWAAFVAMSGGVLFNLWGLAVSSHDPVRPAIAGAVLGGLYAWKFHRRFREDLEGLSSAASARVWIGLMAATIAVGASQFGSTIAGGADSYGYISQADRWWSGRLQVHEPLALVAPWRNASWSLSPLGYRPAASDDAATVPIYAPGFPLLMAAVAALLGRCAMFLVVPAAAAIAVLGTYRLAILMTGSGAVAVASGLVLAASPPFLFMSMSPMSDVPATATAVCAAVLVLRGRPLSAGAVAGLGLLIRPNLVALPLALVVPFLFYDPDQPATRGARARNAFSFLTVVAAFGGVVAAINDQFYGSPFSSGYGRAADLFALSYWPINAVRYPDWLTEVHSALIWLWPIGIVAMPRRAAAMVLGVVSAVFLSYLFYRPFDEWWYLRFVLPALPFLYIGFVSGVRHLVRRLPVNRPVLRGAFAGTIVLFLVAYSFREATARSVFSIGASERRYADVGLFLRDHASHPAAVIAHQHSGSARYYGGVTTIRYEFISPGEAGLLLDTLRQRDLHTYVLLEDWEIASFERRFAGVGRLEIGKMVPAAKYDQGRTRVYLYDLGGNPARVTAPILPSRKEPECQRVPHRHVAAATGHPAAIPAISRPVAAPSARYE